MASARKSIWNWGGKLPLRFASLEHITMKLSATRTDDTSRRDGNWVIDILGVVGIIGIIIAIAYFCSKMEKERNEEVLGEVV